MLKKTISYVDYEGVQRTEDFYFNLSKAEILEMQLSTTGGLKQKLEKIIATQDTVKLIAIFKDIILKSYGEKSDDGKRFMKSEAISEAFSQTEAYSELFMTLATDDKEAAAFINGLIPEDLAEQIKQEENRQKAIPAPPVNS